MTELVTYQFTEDQQLLDQYSQLQEYLLTGLNLQAPQEHVANTAPSTHVLVVQKGERCIGGARLEVVHAGSGALLAMEREGIRLSRLVPQLSEQNVSYAAVLNVVSLPTKNNRKILWQIYRRINQKARQLGVRYVFTLTSFDQARRFVRVYQALELRAYIVPGVVIPKTIKYISGGAVECLVMLDVQSDDVAQVIEQRMDSLSPIFQQEHDIYELIHYFSCIRDKQSRQEVLDLLKMLSSPEAEL